VAEYGRSKLDWLKEFLELPNGIPSHDTFGRLFAKLDPQGFHDFFTRWARELAASLQGKTVAIDGKTLRGSQDRAFGSSATETSYFISSLGNQAPTLAKAIREHWGIENNLHWCLDIAFREDHCRARKDHGPENLVILRHLATNMLKRETSLKGGMQTKRLKDAWDHGYLLKVLTT
jgi:predicted transposase YbfD/YdcC